MAWWMVGSGKIQIASLVHSPATKARIKQRLRGCPEIVTSPVVRQEVKRRLLKEVQYLLGLLKEKGSVTALRRHLVDVLPHQQGRKRNICEQLVLTFEEQEGDTEEDTADRLRLWLTGLLRDGLHFLETLASRIVEGSSCACSSQGLRLRTRAKEANTYDFGTDHCREFRPGECGVVDFLRKNKPLAQTILEHLTSLVGKEKTGELEKAEEFLRAIIGNEQLAPQQDPCLTVGDLIIALESAGVGQSYTLNKAESFHLYQALGQTLIVRPKNPVHDDVVYPNSPSKTGSPPPTEEGPGMPMPA